MRRAYLLLLLFALITAAVIAVQPKRAYVGAREPNAPQPNRYPLKMPISFGRLNRAPSGDAPAAHDSCEDPAVLEIPVGELVSGPTDTRFMTTSQTDPNISNCMFGSPDSATGYRTVWYKAVMPISGNLIVQAAPNHDYENDYDTVIALFDGTNSCGNLTMYACNDDFAGFQSRVAMQVNEGEEIYIEVADRQLSVNGIAQLNFEAWIEAEPKWESEGGWHMPFGRSRHAAVVVGDDIYIIGGQTHISYPDLPGFPQNDPDVRTPTTYRFNTTTSTWTKLADMPPACALNGYAGTDAAHVNGKIFLPSGYVGDQTQYAGTHCVYTIATDSWGTAKNAPWPGGVPFAYSTVIASPATSSYYVVGGLVGKWLGKNDESQAVGNLMLYSADADFWLSTLPPVNTPRYSAAGALLKNQFICVVGGLRPNAPDDSDLAEIIGDGECYDKNNAGGGWVNIAELNVPRFNAGSAVGPDGLWYVFGGVNAGGGVVPEVEAYDIVTNRWILIDGRYDLAEPARAWPRGGFVGDNLYVFGGEDAAFAGRVVPLVEKMPLPPGLNNKDIAIIPILNTQMSEGEPNDTFLQAQPMFVDSGQTFDFFRQADRFDDYFFDLSDTRTVKIELGDIPAGDDYDIYIYTDNKILLGKSDHLNNQMEQVILTLSPGRYFIVVVAENNHLLAYQDYYLRIDTQ